MTITFPSNTTTTIDEIRGAIGRDVTFYVVASQTPCSVCTLDPVTNTSTDSFCATCSGVYWIDVVSGITVSGHITWGQADQMNWVTGGQFFEGDCRLQVKYTDTNLNAARNCKYVVVDGKTMSVKDIGRRGTPTLNRLVLTLNEEE